MNADFMELSNEARNGLVRPRVHSGQVEKGDAFVLLPASTPGGKSGLDFAAEALHRGASYLVCTANDAAKIAVAAQGAKLVIVPNTRAALGELARAWYHSDKFTGRTIGLTGTNGKTTCAYLLEALLSARGEGVAVFGTVNYRWPGTVRPAPLTTPACLELHEMFQAARKAEAANVVMEVSSHSLEQERVAGLDFDAALLTNLTQDHLDYHENMEAYYQAKARLFKGLASGGVAREDKVKVACSDDEYGRRLLSECAGLPGRLISFGLKAQPVPHSEHLAGKVVRISPKGLHLHQEFQGKSWEIFSPLVGGFNALNLLAVQGLALGLGLGIEDLKALESFTGVPGRLERISGGGLDTFVDYAHTPDALEKAIAALRDAGFRRVITVFGCGGNRDRGKRPLMGRAACAGSDVAVLTSDNPRKEDPQAIMDDVLPGMSGEYLSIADRREATARAVELMRPGDALLVAGKGHEDYQIVGEEKLYYSDQAVLRELLGVKS